ncbi:hypothetical protein LINGRAHAP2_LOCUS4024 [Linum grandiflorum]
MLRYLVEGEIAGAGLDMFEKESDGPGVVKELCSRQWEVHLSHIYRKANNVADYLANLGDSFVYVMHLLDSPDQGLSN